MAHSRQPLKSPLKHIPEALLARLWRERAARREAFTTLDGRRVRVLYPGRPGTGAGPDFRDALLERDGTTVRGDVEVHRRLGEWYSHGHHRDPRYQGVVLHVVAVAGRAAASALSGGGQAPVVELAPLMASPPPGDGEAQSPLWPLLASRGYPVPAGPQALAGLLDAAGEARFLGKSGAFFRDLKSQEAQEVLYRGLMEALGYSRNRQAFLELARRVPYVQARDHALQVPRAQRPRVLEELLLRESGLALGQGSHPAPIAWQLAQVRPTNHPRRRIAGAARLVARYLEVGLLKGLAGLALEGSWQALERGLMVDGQPGDRPAPIGRARAGDMAVNVVLPFFHALACQRGDRRLAAAALALYRDYPSLQDNELTREMCRHLLPEGWKEVVTSARRQQGLLHLFKAAVGGA